MEGQRKGLHICGLVAGPPGAARMAAIALNARSAVECVGCSWFILCICCYRLGNT